MDLILGLLIGVVFLAAYMLPSLLADGGKHPHRHAIFFANILFGWTFLGWGVCFVWAVMGVEKT